jgi:VanZ family protein
MTPAVKRWAPVVLWAAGVFLLSSRTTLPHLPGVLGWDKLGHACEYALGGWLLARALRAHPRGATWAMALGALYALSDELHQARVPSRNSDVHDWLADSVGVLVAITLFHLLTRLRQRRDSSSAPRSPEPITP